MMRDGNFATMASSQHGQSTRRFTTEQLEQMTVVLRHPIYRPELFLPLPMHSVQGALENLRPYLERQQERERKTKRDWFDPEWRRVAVHDAGDQRRLRRW